ncbi:autotransporter domain-containing protein [Salinicola aestuarinus]|uniref:autotransporter domain-containing protein n=1 Tax=Salinicola aestuarinus TaxID=1949082 RepID=UPI00165F6695|nr:autotransporter domain-containing protein [Salinicola aestuarinus]
MQTSRYGWLTLGVVIAGASALPLPALAAPSRVQESFDETVFFGDSLSDSGYYRDAIGDQLSLPAAQRNFIGRFTTNPGPVWAERVAGHYGSNAGTSNDGGNNYAVGGARVTEPVITTFGQAPALSEQVATYLAATGGVADGGNLYTIWGGANDLFAVASGAEATRTIATAVAGEANLIATLESAGANHVLLFNTPDFGLTPRFNGDPSTSGGATALAQQYNTALYAAVADGGNSVIPVDTFSLLQEVVDSPDAYGFTNVTEPACTQTLPLCTPSTLVEPNADQTYLFADAVHPTTATHRIIGDYVVSLLEAPQLQQLLTHSAVLSGRTRANRVAAHLDAGTQADGLRWWGDLRGESQELDSGDLYDATMPAGLLGVDWARGSLVLGGFVGYGNQNADFGNRRGDFQREETTVGLFSGWYTERAWVNAQLSYSWLDYDIDRQVPLGAATRHQRGSPSGDNLTAAVHTGYEFSAFSIPQGDIRTGPIAGVTWQTIQLDGYDEDGQPSTSLSYPDQKVDSLVGRVGWQIRRNGPTFNPYLQLAYNHEFEKSRGVEATLQSLPELGAYEVPALSFDSDYAELTVGARTSLWGVETQVGASVEPTDSRTTTLFLGLGKTF